MHRVYIPDTTLIQDADETLTDETQIHHLKDVLRLTEGSVCGIFNDRGQHGEAKILSISKKSISFKILSVKYSSDHDLPAIILACAIPKKTKFEWILEKATELGASEIIPMITQRTEVRLSADRAEKKYNRFETIVINAVKQCQRTTIPQLHPVTSFKDVLEHATKNDLILIPWLEGERTTLKQALAEKPDFQRVFIMIGPEGDFTQEEAALAIGGGAIPITLGETVLKVETAALATLSVIQTLIRKS